MAKVTELAQLTNARLVRELLPPRKRNTHKGDYGRVLLLCGSTGMTGAARLAAKGALRSGSGLVWLGVPETIYPIVAANAGSELVFPLPCDGQGRLCLKALAEIERRLANMDAVLVGCGLGRSAELDALVERLLQICKVPLVLDADGINAVSGHIDVLRQSACPVVLTPHDGEFARLGGNVNAESRIAEAKRFSLDTGCILLWKGHRSYITDGLNVYRNDTGNPGMATGGSGDVLAGIVAGLLGQHIFPLEAAAAGAWLAGAAGDLAAAELGEYAMLPEDTLRFLPQILRKLGDTVSNGF